MCLNQLYNKLEIYTFIFLFLWDCTNMTLGDIIMTTPDHLGRTLTHKHTYLRNGLLVLDRHGNDVK